MIDEFARHDVGIVISMPHWSTIGALAAAAARAGDALLSSLPIVSVYGNRASLVGWEELDLIGCYGEQCLDAFQQIGVPEARLRLVGNIVLDEPLRLSKREVTERNPALRDFLEGAGSTVMVATSGIDPDELTWFAELARAMASLPGGRIVLRPHPSFGDRAYQHFIKVGGGSDRCAIFTAPRIHDLITVSDVVITDYSTVGAEAVLMGKQLLIVNCTGKRYPTNNYDEDGVALLATAPGQIECRMRELLFDEAVKARLQGRREAFVRRYNWVNDGHAAQRYIQALLDCPRRKPSRKAAAPPLPYVAGEAPGGACGDGAAAAAANSSRGRPLRSS
jgi:hypothetical protein